MVTEKRSFEKMSLRKICDFSGKQTVVLKTPHQNSSPYYPLQMPILCNTLAFLLFDSIILEGERIVFKNKLLLVAHLHFATCLQ